MAFGTASDKNAQSERQENSEQTQGLSATIINERQRISEKPTILVAEDNDVNIQVLCSFLKKLHCEIVIVKDGQKAVDLFTKNQFDLILMDIAMPTLDGLGATKAIRTLERKNKLEPTPIVAVTAHVAPADQHICINAGMNDYISKPVNMSKLTSTFQLWLPDMIKASAA